MCSFELESIVKFLFHYCYVLNGLWKILEYIYFNSFTILVNFPYQLVTNMCEPVLEY